MAAELGVSSLSLLSSDWGTGLALSTPKFGELGKLPVPSLSPLHPVLPSV